ncbi:MAG: isoleucine--tRNA ligase, partial [Firmicutes bacterium]|nr:isoleucine--tRNA ligase [Bacillota bacterium]
MFKKVASRPDFPALEEAILAFWEKEGIPRESLEDAGNAMNAGNAKNAGNTDNAGGKPRFVFYEGPPTANGLPHAGHVLTRVIKDVIPRYKSMRGYYVERKAGWDTHGLPVELEVERELGISGKPQIEEYGVERFIARCKESVFRYRSEWERMTSRVGFWLDMAHPYVTYDNKYIESVWWALKQIREKGLLYRGHKVVPYCPRCGTALSSHEVAQGYAEVEEPSVYVRFPAEEPAEVLAAFGMGNSNFSLDNSRSLRCSFLAWTTTPWTLPANAALAVHPEAGYALVDTGDELLVVAEDRVAAGDTILGSAVSENAVSKSKISGKSLAVTPGAALLGLRYLSPYTFCEVPAEAHAYLVVAGDFVSLAEGTGIVHIAPAFGEDDARAGQANHLPAFQPVDPQGKFTAEVAPWAGRFVKDADPLIIEDLRNQGLLYRTEKVAHTYPFCWRCDTPLLYYARSSWFIRTTAFKDELLAENARINWIPGHIRDGRFGDFLENLVDWAVSRERYWGTPLNIWICSACGHEHAVGSLEELMAMAIETVPPELDLHRPYIDQILLQCPACGGTMRRTPEVVDCWFDSGSMPFAQRHYPFENQELFSATFPADFISEALDQTRGWFYSLLAISILLFGRTPYKNCLVLGHVLDKDGRKMSKHLGNGVDPWEILNTSGADAMRWYLYTASPPWNPTRFYPEAVKEAQRRFLGTLWNVYAFFVLYANIDGLGPEDCAGMPDAVRPEERP